MPPHVPRALPAAAYIDAVAHYAPQALLSRYPDLVATCDLNEPDCHVHAADAAGVNAVIQRLHALPTSDVPEATLVTCDLSASTAQRLHVALRSLGRATRVYHLAWAPRDDEDCADVAPMVAAAYRQWGRAVQGEGAVVVPCHSANLRGPTRVAPGMVLALECAFTGLPSPILDPPPH